MICCNEIRKHLRAGLNCTKSVQSNWCQEKGLHIHWHRWRNSSWTSTLTSSGSVSIAKRNRFVKRTSTAAVKARNEFQSRYHTKGHRLKLPGSERKSHSEFIVRKRMSIVHIIENPYTGYRSQLQCDIYTFRWMFLRVFVEAHFLLNFII